MKVTDVRTLKLIGRDNHGIGGVPMNRSILVVRIDTDEGICGLGEAQDFFGVRDAIQFIKRFLVGSDPLAIEPLVSRMLYGINPPERPYWSPTATPSGPIIWAASGVEMALCDLAGKAMNVPAYNLLGGKYRDSIRIYADRSSPAELDDMQAWREIAVSACQQGFTDIKFDVDFVARDLYTDRWNRAIPIRQLNQIVRRLAAVREAVGWDVELSVDGHWRFDVRDAVRLARALEGLKLMWFEDPVPATNPDALRQVREQSPISICIGEMFTYEQFRLFIDREACDIVHPDILFCGGLRQAKKISDYAEAHYIPLALHNNGGALATIAASHVAAASRDFIGLEYHFIDAPWMGSFATRGAPLIDQGHVRLSERHGFGVELDEDVCRAHLAEGEEFF